MNFNHKRSTTSIGNKGKIVSPFPCDQPYASKDKIIKKHSKDRQGQKIGRYTEHIRSGKLKKSQEPAMDYNLNENSITID